jgi:hypothetical protein
VVINDGKKKKSDRSNWGLGINKVIQKLPGNY